MLTIYDLLKNLILKKRYEKTDMCNKLDVFFTFNRLSVDQYQELVGIVNVDIAEATE